MKRTRPRLDPGAIHHEVIAGMLDHLHRFGGVPVSRRVGQQRPAMADEASTYTARGCDSDAGSTPRTIAIA